MKKIKTDVIVTCVVLTTSKIPLDKFLLDCSPVRFGGAWGHLSLGNLFTLQHHTLTCEDFISEKKNHLKIQIWNAFVVHTGKILGKKTSKLILHLKMDRDTFIKIKNKYLIPRFTIGEVEEKGKKKYIVELGSYEVCAASYDPLSTTPVILGEQLIPEK